VLVSEERDEPIMVEDAKAGTYIWAEAGILPRKGDKGT
jgi:hypothetical protein